MYVGGKRRSGAPVFQESHQIVDRVVPAISLVCDKRLQQCKRGDGAIVCLVLDRTGHRHDVGKLDDLREVAADLQLGIDPSLDPSIDLQEEPLTDPDRRVAAALRRRRRYGQRRRGIAA